MTGLLVFLVILALWINQVHSIELDDAKCEKQYKYFKDAISKREAWAIELFDSWTKLQAGISSGNRVDLGHFDQCIGFEFESKHASVGVIRGQHCMIYYRATANASTHEPDGVFDWKDIGSAVRERNLRLGGGVCMPAVCSTAKVQEFVNEYLSNADLTLTNDYDQSRFCSTSESQKFETIDIIAIVVISLISLLLLSSTAYEIFVIHRNQRPHELFSAFSIYKNGKKLFDTKREKSSNVIQCLPGLRTFAMFHIMLGHRYNWLRSVPNINANDFNIDGAWHESVWSAVVNIHPIAVDTFFVMGGCLLARSILNAIDKRKFNIPKMYLHRYLRVIPCLAFLILFILSLFKFMGNGPYFKFVAYGSQIDGCVKNFWAAFLHIQNYYDPINGCLQASWYLSVDYQLVLVSPLVVYPAYKWGWRFLWLLPVYIIGIIIWMFVAAMMNDYKAVRLLMPYDVGIESALNFYFPTHTRCGPWLSGIILGYVFFKLKGRKVAVNKLVNATMWIVSLGTLIAVLVGLYPLQSVDNPASQVSQALFFALQRNTWGLAIAWIIFSCEMGYGGCIKSFLELSIWKPFGRMSLSFYLVHTLYITVHVAISRAPFFYSDIQLMHIYFGDIIVCTFLASILYLSFEEPILLIEGYIYKRIATKSVS